jgi:predicted deacylase
MHGTYLELAARWKALRSSHDVRVREVACVNAPRTLLCVEAGDYRHPTVALAAGVHGDEPAGPWALLDLVESGALSERFSYRIWPCTNPSGFDAGTRESADGVDLNRTFGRGGQSPEARAIVTANRDLKFVLSIDLHEDCDAEGFYCYEYGEGSIGTAALRALEAAGFAIDERRRLAPDHVEEAASLGGLSYTLALARHAATAALTFETPSEAAWELRIGMHRTAVCAAVAAV